MSLKLWAMLIVASLIGTVAVVTFNCRIRGIIRRRLGLTDEIPIVQARRINGESPVDTIIINVNNNV